MNSKKNMIIIWTLICMIILVILYLYFSATNSQNIGIEESNSEDIVEEVTDEIVDLDIYEKIQNARPINVLILGDSIGANNGSSAHDKRWDILLKNMFYEEFGTQMSITNDSVPGTASIFGIIKLNQEQIENYDAVIVCFGQNDDESFISTYYESLIRAIREKKANIEIITILESSQREYTQIAKSIQTISNAYNLPVADTIEAFSESGMEYDELTGDGIHPNDAGYEIYARTIMEAISQKMKKDTTGKLLANPLNSDCLAFANYEFVPFDSLTKKSGEYFTEVSATAIGLYYYLSPNGGDYTISLDNEKIYERNNITEYSDKESFEVLYWNTNESDMKVSIQLSDKMIEKTMLGVFYFHM